MRAFELIPAIDLLGGRCVRLRQGNYDEVTVYAEDPAALAAEFAAQAASAMSAAAADAQAASASPAMQTSQASPTVPASQTSPASQASQGAADVPTVPASPTSQTSPAAPNLRARAKLRRLHVVDLDGARSGKPENRAAVCAILKALPGVAVELGGGLRELASMEAWLGLGVERVILGTVALREPALVREAARLFPGRIGVGVDARDGRVAVAGWLEASSTDALTLARRFEDAGVAAIIHTDIARDGTGAGPNIEASAALARGVALPVVASGGVGELAHVRAAAAREELAGLIVGRALLDGSFTLPAALEAACC